MYVGMKLMHSDKDSFTTIHFNHQHDDDKNTAFVEMEVEFLFFCFLVDVHIIIIVIAIIFLAYVNCNEQSEKNELAQRMNLLQEKERVILLRHYTLESSCEMKCLLLMIMMN